MVLVTLYYTILFYLTNATFYVLMATFYVLMNTVDALLTAATIIFGHFLKSILLRK